MAVSLSIFVSIAASSARRFCSVRCDLFSTIASTALIV